MAILCSCYVHDEDPDEGQDDVDDEDPDEGQDEVDDEDPDKGQGNVHDEDPDEGQDEVDDEDPDDDVDSDLNLEQQLIKGERGKKIVERDSRTDLILKNTMTMTMTMID